jgi:hypothetical protein
MTDWLVINRKTFSVQQDRVVRRRERPSPGGGGDRRRREIAAVRQDRIRPAMDDRFVPQPSIRLVFAFPE